MDWPFACNSVKLVRNMARHPPWQMGLWGWDTFQIWMKYVLSMADSYEPVCGCQRNGFPAQTNSMFGCVCCAGALFIERVYALWYLYLNEYNSLGKLHFAGTTSLYFNQRVDENINNWHNYQMLMKISKAIDKNVNSWKGDNLTKISILPEISNLTETSMLAELSILTKRSIWHKHHQYTSTSPTSSHLII